MAAPPEYAPAARMIPFLAAVLTVQALANLSSTGCYAARTGTLPMLVNGSTTAVALVSYLVLIPRTGIAGAIAANLLADPALRDEATTAAKLAIALATGDDATFKATATQSVNNGTGDIPSVLLKPVAVTKDNIADTVIKDGFTTKAKICVGAAASKCPL